MKKKLIASITCLSMLLIMLLSSTMAWFTDQKGAQSTMTVGKISIEQTVSDDESLAFINPGVLIDYDVAVENTGNQSAYLRTIFAFEDGTYTDKQGVSRNVLEQITLSNGNIIIPGVGTNSGNKIQFAATKGGKPTLYTVGYYIHAGELKSEAGSDTVTIMDYFMLKGEADDAWREAVRGEYDILVLSQACQVEGLGDDAEIALNTSFGTINSVKCASWFGTMLGNTVEAQISTAEELQEALNNGQTNITLMADIEVTESIVIPAPVAASAMRSANSPVVLDLNGRTISSALAEATLVNNGVLVIANGTIESTAANGGNAISNKGTLTLAKGTNVIGAPFDKESGNPAYTILSSGNLTIEDGVHVSAERGCLYLQGQGETVINGGTFTNADLTGKLDRPVSAHVVYIAGGASNKLTINGGTFAHNFPGTSGGVVVLNISATTVTVNGGNFSGGNYYGKWDNLSDWGYGSTKTPFVVTGGTFTGMDNNYVASGHTVVAHSNGTYSVVPEVENVTLSATEFAGIYAGDTAKTYYVFDKTGLMNLNELFKTVYSGEGVPTIINLEADVDLSGEDWKPIDAMWIIFNGNGHTISNLTASGMDAAGRRSGFWAYAGGVVINDLTLENVTVNGSQAGIFAGSTDDTRINNCFLKGNNVVNFVAGVEEWNGIGAICGIASTPAINVTVVEGATVTLNRGDMVTAFGCTYIDDLTGHISTNSGIITNNGTVTATGSMTFAVSSSDELNKAIDGGAKKILLAKGNYTMPSSSTTGTVTITGTKDTVIDVTLGAYLDSANGVTIEGVTIKTGTGKVNGNGSDYAALYAKDVTYINCTFVGPMRVGRDGAKFINCTFTELGNDYIWTYGNDVTFEGCTFNTVGKAILIYSDGGNEISEVTVKNCTFNATQGAKAGAIANQNCAAIEIHNYGNGVKLVTEGNTYDSNFSGEWRIKTYETGRTQVFVNGTEYTTIAIDGKTMTIDANKDVTVNP